MDNSQRLYRYTNVSGLRVVDYTGTFDLKPKGSGSSVEWRVQFLPDNQPTFVVKTIVATLDENRLRSPRKTLWSPEMIAERRKSISRIRCTDGDIAVNNLESARNILGADSGAIRYGRASRNTSSSRSN